MQCHKLPSPFFGQKLKLTRTFPGPFTAALPINQRLALGSLWSPHSALQSQGWATELLAHGSLGEGGSWEDLRPVETGLWKECGWGLTVRCWKEQDQGRRAPGGPCHCRLSRNGKPGCWMPSRACFTEGGFQGPQPSTGLQRGRSNDFIIQVDRAEAGNSPHILLGQKQTLDEISCAPF